MSENVTFMEERRGYSKSEVDAYIQMIRKGFQELESEKDKLQESQQQLMAEQNQLKQKVKEAEHAITTAESEKKELNLRIQE